MATWVNTKVMFGDIDLTPFIKGVTLHHTLDIPAGTPLQDALDMINDAATPGPSHPAKFSAGMIDVFALLIEAFADVWTQPLSARAIRILDPFAGVGGIHGLMGLARRFDQFKTYGVELEQEWVDQARELGPTLQGDCREVIAPDGWFDVICTSPCYGNRMADHHDAQEKCKACKGLGYSHIGVITRIECDTCKGTGKGKTTARLTYTHQLGRTLSTGSAGAMQWGQKYREFHVEAWDEATRVLKAGGLFILNISNHIRGDKEMLVAEWHRDMLIELGYTLLCEIQHKTPRMGFGANANKRVDHEKIYTFRKAWT